MMKRWIQYALAAALLSAGNQVLAQGQPQLINVPLSRPGEPVTLDIGILSARIEIVGEDRQDAQFEITVASGKRKIITPSGTQLVTNAGYSFEVEEDDNELSVDTDWRADRVNVVARIPRRADIEASTVNDGEIIVSNITGNLELSNTNGPITARGISGSVIAQSVNDTIDLQFASIDDVNATSFESINGDLILRLPPGEGVELHLDTARGEISSDFEVDVVPSQGTVERVEGANGVSVRIENVIVARVNGGGPVVRMKTMQGDIHIREAN